MRTLTLAAVALTLAFAASAARAEEGMWTFDNFPIARANQTLGPSIDQAFLLAAKDRIDPDAVLNMAVSSDTIGGSSGSPVVTADGEMIGANFDSTVLSQRNAYGYDRNVNRSVIVTTVAVTTALREVYDMGRLVEELGAD